MKRIGGQYEKAEGGKNPWGGMDDSTMSLVVVRGVGSTRT